MIPRIKNNFIRPVGTGPTWKLDIKTLPKKFNNYFIEACQAAEEIYDLKQGKLHVMYSGGVDSEYALSIFLHMGMDVVPVIIKMGNFNNHDTEYAFSFCQKKNINPLIVDIDFKEFVQSGKFDSTNQIIKTSTPGRAVACYVLGLLDGSVVCGEGDPHISKNEETNEWYFDEIEHSYCLENYMEYKGIDGTAFFNGYTPEMFSSFLVDQTMRDLADNKIPGKLGSHSSKYIVYNRHSGFNLENRIKYHGYEEIFKIDVINHPDFVKLLPQNTERAYNGHFEMKYYDLIKELI